MKIFVKEKDQEEIEITDWLYWFEENFVKSFDDNPEQYTFSFQIEPGDILK